MELCAVCKDRTAAYNRARYRGLLKRPAKDYCAACRAGLREARRLWRRVYVSRHRAEVNLAQKAYRKRLRKSA